MYRTVLRFAVLAFFFSTPLASQEPASPSHVYEAYFRIEYSDLDAWNQFYWEYSVPVLEELREEGLIEGWNQWQHHTGSQYNIRFAVRTYDWASISTFWAEYLSRAEAAVSAAEWEEWDRMIIEHRDEIWDIGEVNTLPDFETTHLYAAMFRVNFADIEEWDQEWSDLSATILQDAMSEGLLGGWVRLDHNTGGPYNSKHLYLFDDWDRIDDVIFERLLGSLMEEQPERWARINELFHAHDDVIWEPTNPNE